MIKRLRHRFIRIAVLSVAAVMLLLTGILNVANYVSTDNDLKNTLNLIYENQGTIPLERAPAETFADVPAVPPGGKRDGPFTPETPYATRYFVLRYRDDGTLSEASLAKIASVTEENTAEYLGAALAHGTGYGYYGDYRFLAVHTGYDRNMVIFLDCYQELRAVRTVLLWSGVADMACILLVLLLVVLFSGKAVAPVVQSLERQKQFITDASHELKTPITVIATSLRVLEMETGKQKWIDKAKAQTEKLTELVNALVTLSRMDERESPLKMEPFPVSEAVGETAESFRAFSEEKGHPLLMTVAPGLSVCGDEYAVRQLVSILLDNAIKYAVPGTPICVSLEKTRRGVAIRTENRCEGLIKADESKLFERFYRADPSRSTGGGFGIGLSIARSIAEGHHGSLTAKIAEGSIVFTAELR